MNKEEFCTAIENECLNTDNISFSITTAKGLITLFWSVTFRDKTNAQAYDKYIDEIEWANMKLDYLENKYKSIHIYTKKMNQSDAEYFDHKFSTTKQPPVKKGYETDTQSFGGYVKFKNIKEFDF